MSSVMDEDTARAVQTGRAAVGEMLATARDDLRKVFVVFVIGLMGTILLLRAYIWDFLRENTKSRMSDVVSSNVDIIVRTPFDVILLQVKIGLVVGVALAIPMLLYYSRDALGRRGIESVVPISRWKLAGFLSVSSVLFLLGMAYAYGLFFPLMFSFLAENAISASVKPSYDIVMYVQFLLLLTLSFGLAAQLPLLMSALSYTEIVPYEFFRDKWRYAVLGIFVFGALFSPPEPFTQVMWGIPLVTLYVFSLGLAKLVTNIRRRGESDTGAPTIKRALVRLAAVFVAGAFGAWSFIYYDGFGYLENEVWPAIPGSVYGVQVRPGTPSLEAAVGFSGTLGEALFSAYGGTVLVFLVLLAFVIRVLREPVVPAGPTADGTASPADIDVGELDAGGVQAAPIEAFAAMDEDQALELAREAMDEDDPEKAQAILDSFDEAQELEAEREAEDEEHEEDDEGNVVTSTAAGMLDPFTEDETTEDDIGGYYYDIAFILDSLTSKAIWIVATFMIVLAGSFLFLYTGGIKTITDIFSSKMPEALSGQLKIVTLHPVEALIFMLKFSTLLAALSILPIVLYFAWPAVEERGVTTGDRNVLLVWGFTVLIALVGGTLLGFLYIAPGVISILAQDVITSDMVIAYRINSFGWLVIYLTVGVGVLALIPATQVLFHHGNIISYRRQRKSWRGVVIGFFAAAGFLSPSGVFTMFIVAIPASIAYGFGLGLVWLYSLVGRRTPRRHGETAD